jgi:2-polyprenyl-3-methyl-5-hydroxy-6-metoxy-1,4-benzoquinol methylase
VTLELDRVYGGVPRFGAEALWSKRLALRWLRRVPAAVETIRFGESPTIACAAGSAEVVFVCADPEALVPEESQRRLVRAVLESELDIGLPVSNEAADAPLRAAPSVGYVTPADLLEVAGLMADGAGPEADARVLVDRADFPVFAVRRSLLAGLAGGERLSEVPRILGGNVRMAADRGAYVHRYGDVDASERRDLVRCIPAGSRSVLDVGCAQGAPATALRERGIAEIIGIEPDAEDARIASSRYDEVVCGRLDDVSEAAWNARFDAILFGDVLEHLEDPGLALEKVRPWLSSRGRLIASVPNVGNSSVIADLLDGKFDYIPYSILSGTHVRFFTRSSLRDLFESCGFIPEEISGVEPEPTPRARLWRERLAGIAGAAGDLSVIEFVIVARAASGALP